MRNQTLKGKSNKVRVFVRSLLFVAGGGGAAGRL